MHQDILPSSLFWLLDVKLVLITFKVTLAVWIMTVKLLRRVDEGGILFLLELIDEVGGVFGSHRKTMVEEVLVSMVNFLILARMAKTIS